MGDALCGPSNPLQQFRKAAQADRTLQQDRLVSRGTPTQGFRSGPGLSAGNLDPEFEAFQAGVSSGPALHEPQHIPAQHFQPGLVNPQAQLPAWASDFQRLHISPQAQPQARFAPAAPQQSSASWHQDFLRQQNISQPVVSNQVQHHAPVNSMFGGVPRYGAFNQSQFEPSFAERPEMTVAQGKQREDTGMQQWDDEAFAKAFDQAHEEMVSLQEQKPEALVSNGTTETKLEEQDAQREPMNEPFLSDEEWREALNAYAPSTHEEARLQWENMNRYDVSDDPLADQHDILDAIEAESQARFESELQTLPQEKQEAQQPNDPSEADELSRTAGQLLDSVATDTSDKFQNSNFLALMRRLRDREVRVEGDKMVEVRDFSQSSSSSVFVPPSAASTPVSEMSLASSLPMSTTSSQTSFGTAAEVNGLDEPTFPTTVPPYMTDWVDGEGVRHRHSWPANAERCKAHGCSLVEGHMHDEWSDIADTNADAD